MMLRNETWMVALDALWANKVRAFLTTLGVIIGSACIVLVVTVALSGRRYVIQQIEGVGSNLVYARLDIDPNQPIMLQDELSIEDMNAAKTGIPGVGTVAGTRGDQTQRECRVDRAQREFSGRHRRVSADSQFADFAGPVSGRRGYFPAKPGLSDHHAARQVCFSICGPDRAEFARRRTQFYGHWSISGARGDLWAFGNSGLFGSHSVSVDEILSGGLVPGDAVRAGHARPRA